MPGSLFAQQEQTNYGERNADDSPPRRWFVEKQDASDRHDGGAAGQDCRNDGERTTFLEKKEKRDRAGADANAGKQRIIKTNSTEFLTPSSTEPKNRQVDQNRQCRAGFDNETAKTFTNAIGSETGKDLMCAVKHSGNDRIPEPGCHE